MTTKELRTEVVETRGKIRTTHEALRALRARHAELKSRLSAARATKDAARDAR